MEVGMKNMAGIIVVIMALALLPVGCKQQKKERDFGKMTEQQIPRDKIGSFTVAGKFKADLYYLKDEMTENEIRKLAILDAMIALGDSKDNIPKCYFYLYDKEYITSLASSAALENAVDPSAFSPQDFLNAGKKVAGGACLIMPLGKSEIWTYLPKRTK